MTGKDALRRKLTTIGSDMEKVDAYVLSPKDYGEIRASRGCSNATLHIGGVPVKRGRPKLKLRSSRRSLGSTPMCSAHFRSSGRGWQGSDHAVLRKAAKLLKDRRKRA